MFRHGGFNTTFTVDVSTLTNTEGKLLFLYKFQTMNFKISFTPFRVKVYHQFCIHRQGERIVLHQPLIYFNDEHDFVYNCIQWSASLSDATCWQSDLTEIGTWRWRRTSGVPKANGRKLLFVIQTQRSVRKLVFWDQLSSLRSSILRVSWRKSGSLRHRHLPLWEALKQQTQTCDMLLSDVPVRELEDGESWFLLVATVAA